MEYFLFQDSKEVKAAQAFLGEGFKSVTPIAWTPSAVDGLKDAGNINLPHTFANQSIADTGKIAQRLSSYRDWCKMLDKIVSNHVVDIEKMQIHPFLHQVFANRSVFNMYFNEIESIYNLWDANKSATFHFFYYSKEEFSSLSRIFDMIKIQKSWDIDFELHTPEWKLGGTMIHQPLVAEWISPLDQRSNSIFRVIGRYIKHNFLYSVWMKKNQRKSVKSLVASYLKMVPSKKKNRRVLVLSNSYETQQFVSKIEKDSDAQVYYWEDMTDNFNVSMGISVNKIISDIKNTSEMSLFTTYYGVNIFSLIEQTIRDKLVNDLPRYVANIRLFLELDDKVHFDMVVSGHELTLVEAIFAQCASRGILSMTFLHGGTTGYQLQSVMPQYYRYGSREYFYELVYTGAISHFLEKQTEIYNGNIKHAVVGSYYYQRLETEYVPTKRTNNVLNVCYVVGPLGPVFGIDSRRGPSSDPAIYDLWWKIIEIFSNNHKVKLYFKFGRDIERFNLSLFERINKHDFENVEGISSNTSLIDVSNKMDLFLLDSPSTPLSELQITQKPILFYLDPSSYILTEESENLLKKRVMITKSIDEFMCQIKKVIQYGANAPVFTEYDLQNNKFFREFCWDGQDSGERFLNFFNKLPHRKEGDR
jgi:hypothetical protein